MHARIESLHGVSGHADMNGLLKWVGAFESPLGKRCLWYMARIRLQMICPDSRRQIRLSYVAPYPGCEVDLLTNEIVNEGMKIPAKPRKAAQRKADSAFDRLVAAGKRLLDIIYRNEGLSNRDKARFESQINNLADKWEE